VTALPFHPLVVHLAIGMAVAVGVLGPVLLLSWVKDLLPRRSWWLLAVLQGVLLVTAVVAVRSGEWAALDARDWLELERIQHHQALAVGFTVVVGATLLLSVAGALLSDEARARRVAAVAVVGTLVQLVLGVLVGHAGGALVWGPDGILERASQDQPSLRTRE